MEMTDALRGLGIETQIIHRGTVPVNRWDPELSSVILEEFSRRKIPFLTRMEIESIERGRDHHLRLNTNKGELEADLILLALGIRPDVALAREMGVTIGRTGAIQVNFSQQTSREDVYAVVDCSEAFHLVSKRWVHGRDWRSTRSAISILLIHRILAGPGM